MDGEPYQILSGAIHYFRVPPAYWEDRLRKLKACGFNTVETYTCWNLHERKEGQFDFDGMLDLEKFIETAEKLDLNVIIRPGPYICAEWDFGGLPSWLLSYPNMAVRCDDPQYLAKVTPYYKQLFDRIRPHLCTNGGSVIMMQVENEYGSYGDDSNYVRKVSKLYTDNGIDCLLFTSDGTSRWMLSGGTLPELLAVANFGSKPKERKEIMKAFKPDQPFMCGEFWCGWFEHWYEEHKAHKPQEIGRMVQEFFDIGGSFNFYMFHGGTNFAFTNGANYDIKQNLYQPTVTSYDYCAPLSEAGDVTETYFVIREIIEKNTGKKAPALDISDTPKAAYGEVTADASADLLENIKNLASPIHTAYPQTMEQLGQDFGYIVYSTHIKGPIEPLPLIFTHLHDRAHIFVGGKLVGIRERGRRMDEVTVEVAAGETLALDILVENMGRINYGPKLFDQKGIVGGIRLGQRYHFGWDHYCLPMEDLSALDWKAATPSDRPTFYKGTLTINDTPKDTFVRLQGFTKGFVTVNGHNLGRYFNPAGPTKTLFLPAPFLQKGKNEFIIFESDKCTCPTITLEDTPDLG